MALPKGLSVSPNPCPAHFLHANQTLAQISKPANPENQGPLEGSESQGQTVHEEPKIFHGEVESGKEDRGFGSHSGS